jgi:hypothetical protein
MGVSCRRISDPARSLVESGFDAAEIDLANHVEGMDSDCLPGEVVAGFPASCDSYRAKCQVASRALG